MIFTPRSPHVLPVRRIRRNSTPTRRALHIVVALALAVSAVAPGSMIWPPKTAAAATTGFLSPASNLELVGSVVNPGNAYAADGLDAEFDDSADSKYGTFGVSLPAGATVTGIEVQIKARRTTGDGAEDLRVNVTDNDGVTWGSSKLTGDFGDAYSTETVGGPTDLWGRSNWTTSELSDANFAVRVRNNFSSGTVGVDHVAVRVHYRQSDPNPALGLSCGLDIALVVDSSGSIDPTELGQMKNAFKGFVDAFLPGTPTQFSVTEFDTTASVAQGFTGNATAVKSAIDGATSGGFTNWEDGLVKATSTFDPRPAKPDLVVFASDGNPNKRGNPALPGTGEDEGAAMLAAVEQANAMKAAGTRILALGIGDNLNVENLKAISGSVVAPPDPLDSSADVILADFSTLASALSDLANEFCGGKILVQKLLDTDNDGTADLTGSVSNAQLAGWTFDVAGSPSDPSAQTTDATGALAFDVSNGTYAVTETGTAPGTALTAAQCTKGDATVGTVDLTSRTVSDLTMGSDETVSCQFTNAVVPTPPNVTITKTDDRDTAALGEVLHYRLTLSNTGGTDAVGVAVTDTLPPLVTDVTNISHSGALLGGTIVWNGLTVPAGGTLVLTFDGTVPSSLPAGTTILHNEAALGCSEQIELDQVRTACPFSGTAKDDTSVTVAPTIALDKTGAATVSPGATLTYTLNWSVGGNASATNAVITDPIPANTTFVSADTGGAFASGTVTWNLGTKNPGDTGAVSVTVTVSNPLSNGTVLTNTGTFDTDQNDPVSDTVTTTVQSAPTLGLTKAANPTTVNPNQDIRYTVHWSVAGNSSATAVVLTDPVPTNTAFVSVEDGGTYSATTKTVTWNLGTKQPGEAGDAHFTVRANAGIGSATTIANTASLDAAETDPVIATANVAVVIPQVLGIQNPEVRNPDLAIDKSVNDKIANPGDTLTYSVVVKNTGTSDALNVVLTDRLPDGFTFADGDTAAKTWNLGTLAYGQSRTVTYDVKVATDAKAGTYRNTAVVTADGVNPRQDSVDVNVKVPQVLGVATTGPSRADYLLFALGALLVGYGAFSLVRQRRTGARTA
jgi:uncharacterized repeat protein (TIGR01451 family)